MPMPVYNFTEQRDIGDAGAAVLDAYFTRWYDIERVTMRHEWEGIDRVFTCRADVRRLTVEYKTDAKSEETGNFFIETTSNADTGREGWALTCTADRLILYRPIRQHAYVIDPHLIRARLPLWRERYRLKPCVNDGYTSYGVLVPCLLVGALAEMTYNLARRVA